MRVVGVIRDWLNRTNFVISLVKLYSLRPIGLYVEGLPGNFGILEFWQQRRTLVPGYV